MRAALDVITGGDISVFKKAILLQIVYDILKGAPYGFLILILWVLFSPAIDMDQIVLLTGAMAVTFLLQYLIGNIAMISCYEGGYTLCSQARLRLGEHLRKLPMGFFKKRDPGDVTAIMLQDMSFVETIFTHLLGDMIAAFVVPAMLLVFLFVLDWRLALAALATALAALPVLYVTHAVLTRIGKKQHGLRVDTDSRILEYLQGIRYIKAYNLVGRRFSTLERSLKEFHRETLRLETYPGAFGSCYNGILGIGFVVILLLSTYFYFGGTLTIPVFLVFLVIGYQFYQPLLSAALFTMEARYMNIAAERMKEVLDTETLKEPEISRSPAGYDIEFRGVGFSYLNTRVLDNVSFKAEEGTVTALVGPSGSGKTTITNLIARFWDVDAGSVSIGGVDVRDMSADELYSHLSMVFQDVYLFRDTIFNNIRVGRADATEEEVIAAAKAAQAHKFIEKLPEGYDTMVGEGGSTLSGGEKQRVSIARAILKDAPVVLLDEATASLDPENERAIQEALNALISSKTLIVIAHRLSTIADADRIVVLKDGRVAESGTHEGLCKEKGQYFRMWQEQEKAGGWTFESSVST
ncbi:MAG: ATP-binding cassette, subfamily bacterial IrtB/YbtQ [Methanofollis sp.]|nr:ATP-binding cassette, subfamily bacterial IrtB/YbtQ [Methanofollis sp.]